MYTVQIQAFTAIFLTDRQVTIFGKSHLFFFFSPKKYAIQILLVWESQVIILTISISLFVCMCVSCNPKIYILPQENFSNKLNNIIINL